MRTEEQIQERIDSLDESLSRLGELLNSSEDMEETLEIENDMVFIEAKINSLLWVLN